MSLNGWGSGPHYLPMLFRRVPVGLLDVTNKLTQKGDGEDMIVGERTLYLCDSCCLEGKGYTLRVPQGWQSVADRHLCGLCCRRERLVAYQKKLASETQIDSGVCVPTTPKYTLERL